MCKLYEYKKSIVIKSMIFLYDYNEILNQYHAEVIGNIMEHK